MKVFSEVITQKRLANFSTAGVYRAIASAVLLPLMAIAAHSWDFSKTISGTTATGTVTASSTSVTGTGTVTTTSTGTTTTGGISLSPTTGSISINGVTTKLY